LHRISTAKNLKPLVQSADGYLFLGLALGVPTRTLDHVDKDGHAIYG